jgi:CzcA family heavy metal efflux pump
MSLRREVMWAKIIEFSLKNRLFVLIAAVITLIWGYSLFQRIPVDLYPDINDPRVTILTEAPGWSPEEIEALVTFPLESAFNGTPFVTRVRSSSGIGISVVFIEFEWGTDIFKARQLVAEKLQTVKLPAGVEAPFMAPITSRLGEIVEYALEDKTGKYSPMDLRDVADWIIRFRLKSVGGIANVINQGGLPRQYQVQVSPDKLLGYGLNLMDVREALEKGNMNASGGFLLTPTQEYLIRGFGRVQEVGDIENAVITTKEDGIPVLIKDVATVKMVGPAIRRGAGTLNGQETVLGKITKQPDTNTLTLTKKILEVFKELEKSLPAGIVIKPEYLQSDLIERALATVKEALLEGGILVVGIIVIFLFNLRTSLISLTAIPLSFVLTLMILYWYGLSLNNMTLAGLAIAVGMVVDDAIIDVENIFRRLREYFFGTDQAGIRQVSCGGDSPGRVFTLPSKKAQTPSEVVLKASNEIRSAVVFATLIIILVFIPLFTLEGLEGRLFYPLGLAVVISMAASLVVALTVTPVLSDLMLTKPGYLNERESPLVHWLKKRYRSTLQRVLEKPKQVLIPIMLLFLGSLVLIPFMGREFLPIVDEGTLLVNAVLPPGTSLEQTMRVGVQIEKALLEFPEVVSTTNRLGRAEEDEHAEGVNTCEILVSLLPPEKRKRSREELLTAMRKRLQEFPGVLITIGQPLQHRIDHLLSGVNAQVAIKLFGNDLNVLRTKAEEIRRVVSTVPGVADLFVEQQVEVPQLKIQLDRKAVARYGVTVADISHFIETALKGEAVGQVLLGQRQYDLVVILDERSRADIEKLKQLIIQTPTGSQVSLEQLATVQISTGPNTINRENVARRIVIQSNVSGRDLNGFVQEVQQKIADQVKLPEGYFVTYGGQFESQQRAFKRLTIEFILITVVMFSLLYISLRSTLLAIAVLLNLPLAIVGGIMSIYLSSGVLNVSSLVGFILLFGIAVRNGVLMVSHINDLRYNEGLDLDIAIIQGAEERMTPVLMTALATAIGMVPLLWAQGSGSELQKPLATVIVGGTLSATALTLLVLPILYRLIEGRGKKVKSKKPGSSDPLVVMSSQPSNTHST